MRFSEELIKRFGTEVDYVNKKMNDLHEQFLEMGQLKSDFDIEKFTVMSQGKFIAHQFHMLMRQYVLALYEAKRMLNEREAKIRDIKYLTSIYEEESKTKSKEEIKSGDEYIDLKIEKLFNEIKFLEVQLANKLAMIDQFEKCRCKIISDNNGKIPTNEQYQVEEPKYWKEFIENKALWSAKERLTGIGQGLWENIHFLEEDILINPNFQVKMLDDKNRLLDLQQIEKERVQKSISDNHVI